MLRGETHRGLDITVCLKVLSIRLNLIAVMSSEASGGVIFKVGLDSCEASEVLGMHMRV